MIFIGYSSEDRYTVVEPLLFHLRNYGFKVWYDFDNMYLGDSRKQENFEKGIKGANYLIFIITHGFFESSCAKEELEYAHQLVEQCGYIMFTVFYKFLPQELPSRYDWLRNYIFNEIAMDTGTRYAADQIVERIVKDSLSGQSQNLCKQQRSSAKCQSVKSERAAEPSDVRLFAS